MGAQLRQLVQHGEDMHPRTEALLYAADRSHHVAHLIRPSMDAGGIVITDRYLDSSVAYQAAGRMLDSSEVENLSLWATGGLLPDITLLLDVDEATATARQASRPGGQDRLESAGQDFHERVRVAYRKRAGADLHRWVIVSAAGTVDQVHQRVRQALAPRIAQVLGLPVESLEALDCPGGTGQHLVGQSLVDQSQVTQGAHGLGAVAP